MIKTGWRSHKKKPSPFQRMFGAPPPGIQPDPPDITATIDEQVDGFWEWLRAGCPYETLPATETDIPDPMEIELSLLQLACTSRNRVELGALAGHPSEWVRLGVAGNPYSPPWAIWGDGMVSFGLVADKSAWVAASARLRSLKPPRPVVEAIKASTMSMAAA